MLEFECPSLGLKNRHPELRHVFVFNDIVILAVPKRKSNFDAEKAINLRDCAALDCGDGVDRNVLQLLLYTEKPESQFFLLQSQEEKSRVREALGRHCNATHMKEAGTELALVTATYPTTAAIVALEAGCIVELSTAVELATSLSKWLADPRLKEANIACDFCSKPQKCLLPNHPGGQCYGAGLSCNLITTTKSSAVFLHARTPSAARRSSRDYEPRSGRLTLGCRQQRLHE